MVRVIIFLFLSWSGYSQTGKLTDAQLNSSGANKLFFIQNILQAQNLAKSDIENGTPILFLQSGIAPIVFSKDSIFEKDFNVYYYDLGDVAPKQQFVIEYNQVIFEHLTKLYKKKWKRKVRKDVVGYRTYKMK